jgi:hypothetical protein
MGRVRISKRIDIVKGIWDIVLLLIIVYRAVVVIGGMHI